MLNNYFHGKESEGRSVGKVLSAGGRRNGRMFAVRRLLMRMAIVVLAAGSVLASPVEALGGSKVLTVEPSTRPITRDTIRSVQRMLAVHGYDPGQVDGLPGRKTRIAVSVYQGKIGMPVDGKITRRFVNRLSRDTVKLVQEMLTAQGFKLGRFSGRAGPRTEKAIREYRALAGLRASGKITQDLVDRLFRDTAKMVQRMLTVRGYDAGETDGVVGRRTAIAIRDYQTQTGMTVDGKISMELVGNLRVETIKLVQGTLAARGYDAGPIDGDVGRKTAIAISEYQAEAGLPVDGKFSIELAESLSLSSGGAAPGAATELGNIVIGYPRGDITPVYEVGDTFAYSDGRIETVVRVGGNRVWWRSRTGENYTTYNNFLLPRVAWQTESGSGETTTDIDVKEAWPTKTRKQVSFSVNVFWTPAGAPGMAEKKTESWRCRRNAGVRVTVAAGIFETIPIVCERRHAPKDSWRRRVWYYAPAVRHFIRLEEVSGGKTLQIDLVAVRPGGRNWPPAARAGLDQAVQDTLQNLPVGEEVEWGSTAIRAKFGIKPTGEIDRLDGSRCRTFVLIRSHADNPRVYPAVACRDEEESSSWFVPHLDREEDTVAGLAAD